MTRALRVLSVGFVIALGAAGCSGSGDGGGKSLENFHRTTFDAANFVDPRTSSNRWFPLRPGMQWVRQGTTDVGFREVPHQVVSTMTDVIREIDGVRTIAMLDQDTDAGQLAEASIDYFGLDKDGNVWLLGSYTADYSGGTYTHTADAWLGGSAGGSPGILLPADPGGGTPPWVVSLDRDGNGTGGEVVATGARKCVQFACYEDVVTVREQDIGGGEAEYKYYAPDVGQILNSPRQDSKHKDQESLVNLTRLSPAGLDEMSTELLRLEDHARENAPELFRTPSTRGG
jgi:hypothetical protein